MLWRILLIIFSFGAQAQTAPWAVNLEEYRGVVNLVSSAMARHPRLFYGAIPYRRNPVDLFLDVPEILDELGDDAYPSVIGPSMRFGAEAQMGEYITYVPASVVQVKLEAKRAAEILAKENFSATDMIEDARYMHLNRAPAEIKTAWLKSVPFLYFANGDGRPRAADPETMTGNDLDSAYFDTFSGEQEPALTKLFEELGGEWKMTLDRYRNQFLKRLREQLTPRSLKDESGVRVRISLEEVPPLLALLRGEIGFDCIGDWPYHALVKGSRVFWIRDSFNFDAEPVGYIFVREVQRAGKIIPYFVTANGSRLRPEEVQLAVRLITEKYQSPTALVPDFAVNEWIVNSDPMRSGLGREVPGRRVSDVDLGEGWAKVDELYKGELDFNHYNHEHLRRARLVSSRDFAKPGIIQARNWPTEVSYAPMDVKNLDLLARASLSLALTPNISNRMRSAVAKLLDVSETAADLARKLFSAENLSAEDRKAIHEGLGVPHSRIFRSMPVERRVEALLATEDVRQQYMGEDQWRILLAQTVADFWPHLSEAAEEHVALDFSPRFRPGLAARSWHGPVQPPPANLALEVAIFNFKELLKLGADGSDFGEHFVQWWKDAELIERWNYFWENSYYNLFTADAVNLKMFKRQEDIDYVFRRISEGMNNRMREIRPHAYATFAHVVRDYWPKNAMRVAYALAEEEDHLCEAGAIISASPDPLSARAIAILKRALATPDMTMCARDTIQNLRRNPRRLEKFRRALLQKFATGFADMLPGFELPFKESDPWPRDPKLQIARIFMNDAKWSVNASGRLERFYVQERATWKEFMDYFRSDFEWTDELWKMLLALPLDVDLAQTFMTRKTITPARRKVLSEAAGSIRREDVRTEFRDYLKTVSCDAKITGAERSGT